MRSFDGAHVWRFITVMTLVGAVGCMNRPPDGASSADHSAVESHEPPVGLLDLNGQPFDLWSHGQARVTVLVFTRSDCPISNRFAPEIRRLHELYQPRDVDFCLVYVDPYESADDIRRHMQEFGYNCQVARDPKHALVSFCKAKTTPEAVVFDKNRVITYQGRVNDLYVELGRSRSEPTVHDLADAIEATVSGRPIATPRAKAIGCAIADLARP